NRPPVAALKATLTTAPESLAALLTSRLLKSQRLATAPKVTLKMVAETLAIRSINPSYSDEEGPRKSPRRSADAPPTKKKPVSPRPYDSSEEDRPRRPRRNANQGMGKKPAFPRPFDDGPDGPAPRRGANGWSKKNPQKPSLRPLDDDLEPRQKPKEPIGKRYKPSLSRKNSQSSSEQDGPRSPRRNSQDGSDGPRKSPRRQPYGEKEPSEPSSDNFWSKKKPAKKNTPAEPQDREPANFDNYKLGKKGKQYGQEFRGRNEERETGRGRARDYNRERNAGVPSEHRDEPRPRWDNYRLNHRPLTDHRGRYPSPRGTSASRPNEDDVPIHRAEKFHRTKPTRDAEVKSWAGTFGGREGPRFGANAKSGQTFRGDSERYPDPMYGMGSSMGGMMRDFLREREPGDAPIKSKFMKNKYQSPNYKLNPFDPAPPKPKDDDEPPTGL
ncbi:hypothetical protein HDU91_001616, partial [Kappamyces sp. JEL0680]